MSKDAAVSSVIESLRGLAELLERDIAAGGLLSEGAATDPLMTEEVPPVTLTNKDELEREILGCKDELREIETWTKPNVDLKVREALETLQKRLTGLLSLL